MLDPFPQEIYLEGVKKYQQNFTPPKNMSEMIYREHKYQPDSSPFILYKPRKDVLFKMMRACINVKNES